MERICFKEKQVSCISTHTHTSETNSNTNPKHQHARFAWNNNYRVSISTQMMPSISHLGKSAIWEPQLFTESSLLGLTSITQTAIQHFVSPTFPLKQNSSESIKLSASRFFSISFHLHLVKRQELCDMPTMCPAFMLLRVTAESLLFSCFFSLFQLRNVLKYNAWLKLMLWDKYIIGITVLRFNFKLSSLQNNNELNCVLVFVCILRAKLAIDDFELARHALLQKEDKNDKQKTYF